MKKLLIFLILLTLSACGGKTDSNMVVSENQHLSPHNIMENAFSTNEESFFQQFEIEKTNAVMQNYAGSNIYVFDNDYSIKNQDTCISVEFKNGEWRGITYEILFEGDNYIENAYTFMYAYDQEVFNLYGMPLEYNDTTFLKSYPSFDVFKEKIESENSFIFNLGDTYVINDDKLQEILISADNEFELAKVTVQIYRYEYRAPSE